jgi:hypothetical protein
VEFVDALDLLLRDPAASYDGQHFTAVESRTYPGCVQQPRVPFTIAAAGPNAMRVVAQHGEAWVTFGPPAAQPSEDEWLRAVAAQTDLLDAACADAGRAPQSMRRMALISLDLTWAQSSIAGWQSLTGRLAQFGFTDVVVHWPRPHDRTLPGPAPAVFDHISAGLG